MDEPLSHVMKYARWQAFGVCTAMYSAATQREHYAALDCIFYGDIGRPRLDRLATPHCKECPVQRLCLEDALVHGEVYGIWGGLDYKQRDAFSRSNEGFVLDLMRQAIEENWLQESRIEYAKPWTKARVWKMQRMIHLEQEAAREKENPVIPSQLIPDYENFPQFSLHMEAS